MCTPIRALVAAAAVAACLGARADATPSPCAGQQSRTIRALSDSEVAGLLAGNGAGFAKAAELNSYPGPAHVLDLASDLHLDATQQAATRELLSAHKARAKELGEQLVAAEREPDRLFAQRRADAATVDRPRSASACCRHSLT